MKINVAVLFGGKSVEHEISVISALQAINNIDKEKYDIIPVYITKQGEMYSGPEIGKIESYKNIKNLLSKSYQITFVNTAEKTMLVPFPFKHNLKNKSKIIDVVFPVVHGTNVEDGGLQGYLKTLGVPFVGCDVLASAVGMDKHVMKLVFQDAGIPVLSDKCYLKSDYFDNEDSVLDSIEKTISYPVIVKPVNLGSSVGISKAANRNELTDALDLAFQFSAKVLVERAVTNLREINCAVLGDIYEAIASECEEPLNATDILSYEDKYLSSDKSGGASKGMASLSRKIPAELDSATREEIRTMAVNAFKALGCNGVARIDFIIDKDNNQIYLNEINTIPGSLAFYLWQPVGIPYPQLLDRMINLALKRAREENDITYSFDTNVLESYSSGGSKSGKHGKI